MPVTPSSVWISTREKPLLVVRMIEFQYGRASGPSENSVVVMSVIFMRAMMPFGHKRRAAHAMSLRPGRGPAASLHVWHHARAAGRGRGQRRRWSRPGGRAGRHLSGPVQALLGQRGHTGNGEEDEMIVAVTGAAGRIGRAMLQELKHAGGHTVWALDQALPPAGLAQRALLVDLADAGLVYGALAGAEAVIHLGAIASEANHPGHHVFANNTRAAANVAAACIDLGIPRVVYSSSITIYGLDWQARHGGITALPVDESLDHRPDDFYALSKYVGEETFALAAREHGLRAVSMRVNYVVGEDEYAERGQPREQRDASGGLWSYVDARDVALAARLALERLDALGPGNHSFNVGAADAHSRLPLCEVIPRFIPELKDLAAGLAGAQTAYSIEKARRVLGYEPRHSWRQALGEG
jgi:nucleoside-diphosphate-sugar epimerase